MAEAVEDDDLVACSHCTEEGVVEDPLHLDNVFANPLPLRNRSQTLYAHVIYLILRHCRFLFLTLSFLVRQLVQLLVETTVIL